MFHNQSDFVSNLKSKRDANLLKGNKTIGSLNLTKVRSDRAAKSKSERNIPVLNPVRQKKLHNCLAIVEKASSCEKPLKYMKRKSISMVELPCQSKATSYKKTPSKEHGDEKKIKLILRNPNDIPYLRMEEHEIARKACKMFILHAWRSRRAQVSALQSKTQRLDNEVQNFNIQTVVLRNLLESEKLRVTVALSDSSHLKGRLETELNTVSELRKSLTQLEQEKSKLERTQKDMQMEINSLNSELENAREGIKRLQEDTSQLRKELTSSKEVETQLVTKLGVAESRLKDKTSCLNELKKRVVEFKTRIAELVEKNCTLCKEGEVRDKELQIAMKEISKKDIELGILRSMSTAQGENIANLEKDLTIALSKTIDQEDTIMFLEKTINAFRVEKENDERSRLHIRYQAMFQAIKFCAALFIPGQQLKTI